LNRETGAERGHIQAFFRRGAESQSTGIDSLPYDMYHKKKPLYSRYFCIRLIIHIIEKYSAEKSSFASFFLQNWIVFPKKIHKKDFEVPDGVVKDPARARTLDDPKESFFCSSCCYGFYHIHNFIFYHIHNYHRFYHMYATLGA